MTYQTTIDVESRSQFELVDVTAQIKKAVKSSKIKNGIVAVFSPHTTAGIVINHNEPLLKQDVMKMLYRLIPIDINYAHDFFEIRSQVKPDERSNGHAHVKQFLLGNSETIPVAGGEMALGARQSIFLVESDGARKRRVIIQILGE